MTGEEVRKTIIEAIKELPEDKQKALALYYNEGLTPEEIAEVLLPEKNPVSPPAQITKELLKYANLDTLLNYAPLDSFPPEILFAILEEYRRRIADGKFILKVSHLNQIINIAGTFYDQVDKNDQLKIVAIFNDIELLFKEKEKVDCMRRVCTLRQIPCQNNNLALQGKVVDWDKIFSQCEEDSEREYYAELKKTGEYNEGESET